MDRKFGGIIWTDHALERLSARNIKQGDAWATWKNPEQSRRAHKGGNWIYYRTYGDRKLEVVTGKSEKGETVVLSVWSRPVCSKVGGDSPTYGGRGGNVYSGSAFDRGLEKVLRFLLGRRFLRRGGRFRKR